jgi:uncharacterized membrane protein (UPF0127 family)
MSGKGRRFVNRVLLAVLLVLLAAWAVRCVQSGTDRGREAAPVVEAGPGDGSSEGWREWGPQPTLPMTTIRVGGKAIRVEVADEPQERRLGYMGRERPAETGMLFVWPRAEMQGFWMKNCDWDIDLAYVSQEGRIFQVERMRAHDERSVRSVGPARYVLEMPAGRFAELGIGVGQQVEFSGAASEE